MSKSLFISFDVHIQVQVPSSNKGEDRLCKSNLEEESNAVINNSIEEVAGNNMLEQVITDGTIQIPIAKGGKKEVHSEEGWSCAELISQRKIEEVVAAGSAEGIPSFKNKFDALGTLAEEGEILVENITPVIQFQEEITTQKSLPKATDPNKDGTRSIEDSSSTFKKKGMKQLKGLGPINLKTRNRKTDNNVKEKEEKSSPLIHQ
ncbi:hypothetical protein MA16_Dca024919 [Dendrobium catenatum]|uniref:Uncharacterized protein n=1 Tax=Dendrobium catenatum TaxID=906689 RepID=A0A2I0WDD4_9ASPA|nr:hypothetical protein MA16_Dca024919 [Dendrobium catenatum]